MRLSSALLAALALLAAASPAPPAGDGAAAPPEAPRPVPPAAGGGDGDFGDGAEDAVLTRDFEIPNARALPLRLLGLHPSCGCLSLRTSAREISPGGKATVTATYSAAGMEGGQAHSISVATDDPDRRSIRWAVRGRVRDLVRVTPGRSIFMGRMRPSESRRKEILVQPGADAPKDGFDEAKIVARDPDLEVAATPLEPGGRRGLRLAVGPGPDHPPGVFGHDLTVLVRIGKKELRIRISVSGAIEGSVVALPARVDLGAFRRSEFRAPKILVGSPAREKFKVLAVAAQDRIEPVPGPSDLPGAVVLELRLRDNVSPGSFGEDVRIATDHPKAPLLVVPVTGTLLPDWTIEPAEALLRLSARDGTASISLVFAGPDPPRALRPDIPASLPVLAEAVPRDGTDVPAAAWRVRIRLAPAAKESASGVLVLKADAKTPFSVPLSVRILP